MPYVDGYLLTVPEKNLDEYRRIARIASKVWLDHGALEYRECVQEDSPEGFGVPFAKAAKAKPGEVVIFAWVVYKSRAQRDRVNAKVFADPRIHKAMDPKNPPFDCKRMSFGGFNVLVQALAKKE